MSYDLIAKFQRAASELKTSNQKSRDFCTQIIDNPDFINLLKPWYVMPKAF